MERQNPIFVMKKEHSRYKWEYRIGERKLFESPDRFDSVDDCV